MAMTNEERKLMQFALDKLEVGTTLNLYRSGSPNSPDPQIEELRVTSLSESIRNANLFRSQSHQSIILRYAFKGWYKDSPGNELGDFGLPSLGSRVRGDIMVNFSRVFLILHEMDQPNQKPITVELVTSADVGLKFFVELKF